MQPKSNLQLLVFFAASVCFSSIAQSQVIESGFGHASILHTHYDVAPFAGSYEKLFSEKSLDPGAGTIAPIYNLPQVSGNLGDLLLSAAGDLNGDGMDEAILVYKWGTDVDGDGKGDNTKMYFVDGNDGQVLFSYNPFDSSSGGYGCYLIEVGDFDGDGMDEVAHARHASADINGDGFADGTYLQIFDGDGTELWGYSPQDFGLSDTEGIFLMKAGEITGDHSDDLVVVHHWGEDVNDDQIKDNSWLVVLDVKNGIFGFDYHPFGPGSGGFGCYMIEVGDFDADGIDEIAHARHASQDLNGDGFADGTYLQFFDGAGNQLWQYSPQDFGNLTDTDGIFLMKAGDVTRDQSDDLVVVHHWGLDVNEDEIGDNSQLVVLDVKNQGFGFDFHPFGEESGGFGCFMIELGDFDNDGIDEIVHARHSSEDVSGDGFADGTYLQIFDDDGSQLWGYSPPAIGLSETDGAFLMQSGDFDGDGYDDLAVVHHSGNDANGDQIGDNSTLVISDINTQSFSFSYSPTSWPFGGYGCYNLLILKNEISDRELLRSINFSASTDPSFLAAKSDFENRDYAQCLSNLHAYYSGEKAYPVGYYISESYSFGSPPIDSFSEHIQKFSTALTKEEPCISCSHNNINHPTSGNQRMARITSTLVSRATTGVPFTLSESDFTAGLKSVLSHARWASSDKHYVSGTNHGILFELWSYIPVVSVLSEFNEFLYSHPGSWQVIAEERIDDQTSHVLSDGVHDEYSLNYGFWVADVFDRTVKFITDNSSLLSISSEIAGKAADASRDSYSFFLHAVKPLAPSRYATGSNSVTDLPIFGDSYGIIDVTGGFFGKIENVSALDKSLLYRPILKTYSNNWNGATNLIANLKFAANATNQTGRSAPDVPSKVFPESGFFVSRSNWKKAGTMDELDFNARYCLFKSGEIIPTPGPFSGFKTSSRHAHADLLSLDLAGYGKNIVTDPGGYVNPDLDDLIEDFNGDHFESLYGYPTVHDDFNTARHYFKGTAAHNTVYADNQDQADYAGEWTWNGLGNLTPNPIDYALREEFDLVSAGYEKLGELSHDRTVSYVRPSFSGTVQNDYWVMSDIVVFDDPGPHTTNQIWHISPDQDKDLTELDPVTGIFQGENFWMLPLLDSDNSAVQPQLIDGYYSPDKNLIQSEIVKYYKFQKKGSNARDFAYLTVVFPFANSQPLTNPTALEKLTVFDEWGEPVEDKIAQAFRFSIELGGPDPATYFDHVLISHSSAYEELNWDSNGDGELESTLNRFEFFRYSGTTEIKHLSEPWNSASPSKSGTNDTSVEGQFFLEGNYPNPFNPSTTIVYNLPEPIHVTLTIYNSLGQKVRTLVRSQQKAGLHSIVWNGTNQNGHQVASGVYIYRLKAGDFVKSDKMFLIR